MLFDKAIIFTDIHWGEHNNSKQHNEDCLAFMQWMIAQAKKENIDTCIFCGDWAHNRNNVNVMTLNYMTAGLSLLNSNFKQTYFLIGNHDLYYKESRNCHSSPYGKEFNNIKFIENPTVIKDCLFAPWLIGDEWKELKKTPTKYAFTHLELPSYMMNQKISMPDIGGLKTEDLSSYGLVFSGHFHIRQRKNNVIYIGNPFGHNFNDANDFSRGCCVLEWDKEPIFIDYIDGPKYITTTMSVIADQAVAEKILLPNSTVKLHIDVNLTYEEISSIRDILIMEYNLRDVRVYVDMVQSIQNTTDAAAIQSLDQIVVQQISSIVSDKFDKNVLLEIYNDLD